MKKVILINSLLIFLVNPLLAGTLTIERSGASVDEFLDGYDAHSLSDTIYEHGIVLGDGFWKAEPLNYINIINDY